ncbi:hypothetical protein LTR28_003749 [Elasticomyces elasticus]|nr:hypothetical protein LTR28_003749 [Elasticomyces elasticus]
MKHSQRNQRDILIMRVPYLGSIQLSREGVAALPAARIEQAQSLSEGVTIGGIGSMLIGRPHSSDSSEDHGTANITVLPAAPTSATYDPSQHHPAAHNAPVISAGSPMGSDLMFPDAAASFDDWVFQGVDTAGTSISTTRDHRPSLSNITSAGSHPPQSLGWSMSQKGLWGAKPKGDQPIRWRGVWVGARRGGGLLRGMRDE